MLKICPNLTKVFISVWRLSGSKTVLFESSKETYWVPMEVSRDHAKAAGMSLKLGHISRSVGNVNMNSNVLFASFELQ